MNKSIKKIAVIGTGVIGSGWIIRFLANKKKVYVYDKNINQKKFLLEEIKRTKKIVSKFYNIKKDYDKNIIFSETIEEAVKNADLIQENVPENIEIKGNIINQVSLYAKKKSIIASSSSGLLPSAIQQRCINPERFIIAHPFNPVYLLPLVELVKGNKTKNIYLKKANLFYKSIGMHPLMLKKEIEGYLSDRLQEAMWRESLHIINEGYATTKELDEAIIHGPGLRWSLMGTFLTFHLAGGKLGMKHMLEQFGPTLKLPWTKLKAPKLSTKLKDKIVKGTKYQSKGLSINKLSNIRDSFLLDLIKLKKKYNIK